MQLRGIYVTVGPDGFRYRLRSERPARPAALIPTPQRVGDYTTVQSGAAHLLANHDGGNRCRLCC